MPEVHTFDQTSDVFSEKIVVPEEVKDGDVMVCVTDGVIGFLYGSWALYVVADKVETSAGTHVERGTFMAPPLPWDIFLERFPRYEASVKKCLEVAWADGDITGNDHWKEAKDPREA